MRIVLLGAPGSGKGTQAKQMAKHLSIPQISTGDLLRAAVAEGTELGLQARAAMDAGQLVPDGIVLGMIRERLGQPDTARGFILDGFPRNIAQAGALDQMLSDLGQPLDAVLLIDIEFDVLLERLSGRLSCESCGAVFNRYTNPPRTDSLCDACGGNLRHRADDNEATISNRLRVYDLQTRPLIAYYRAHELLYSVNGEGDIGRIFRNILAVLAEAAGVAALKKAAPKNDSSGTNRRESPAGARRRDASSKAAPKKAAPKKAAPKKVAPKKVAPKKVAPKKAAPKKAAPKKAARKR